MFLVLLAQLDNNLFKIASQLKDLCWVILGNFGTDFIEFLCLLRAVKPLLHKSLSKYLLYSCHTYWAKNIFHSRYFSPGGILGVLFGRFCGIFSLFLEDRFCFLWNFLHKFLMILWWLLDQKTLRSCCSLFRTILNFDFF